MSKKSEKTTAITSTNAYPLTISIAMVVGAVVLSFVDLTFLNDVIGKILDLGSIESILIAFSLGLVGMAIMAHLGIKEAHAVDNLQSTIMHYLLWISLGVAFVLIRMFSAEILGLDSSLGDELLLNVSGLNIRQVDLILGPVMLVLYLATGILAKDGFKNLLTNPGFNDWRTTFWDSRKAKKIEEKERRAKAEKRTAKQLEEAERSQRQREKEKIENDKRQKVLDEEARIKNALNGTYSNALVQYREKDKEIKEKYQKISTNIDFIRSIDKQEDDFRDKVKPSLLSIVDGSIHSVQNNVALAIRKNNGGDITDLRDTIEAHNHNRHEQSSKND